AAQTADILRIVVSGVILPARIIALLEQCPAEYRHQLREPWMHAGAVQAFVVVLPEHFPVALDRLGHPVTDNALAQLPAVEPLGRQVETRREWRRIRRQGREHEAVPLHRGQTIERVVAHLEAIARLTR